MGGSSSTPRRVTITEDEASGAVEISEAVARRLMGHPEEPQESQATPVLSSQDRDEELRRLEAYYQKRISSLEGKNRDVFSNTNEQFAQTVQEVEAKFVNQTSSPVCCDLQKQVLKCYQDNPRFTLYCGDEVRAFNACVQAKRESTLTAK